MALEFFNPPSGETPEPAQDRSKLDFSETRCGRCGRWQPTYTINYNGWCEPCAERFAQKGATGECKHCKHLPWHFADPPCRGGPCPQWSDRRPCPALHGHGDRYVPEYAQNYPGGCPLTFEDENGEPSLFCPECRCGQWQTHRREQCRGMPRSEQLRSWRCVCCGQKALVELGPTTWQCYRCGIWFKLVDKNTIISETGRLSQEQRKAAKRCVCCGKKRLVHAGPRRWECHECGQCYLQSEAADPSCVFTTQRGRPRRGFMSDDDLARIAAWHEKVQSGVVTPGSLVA